MKRTVGLKLRRPSSLVALLLVVAGLFAAGLVTAAPASAQSQYTFHAVNGGYLNNSGASPSRGNHIIIWQGPNSPYANDYWYLDHIDFDNAGNDLTYIRNSQYNGMCLDVPNSNFSTGVYLDLWSCNRTGAQTFKLHWTGSGADYVIAADWNGSTLTKCLDVHNNNNGTGVWLWPCNGTRQQIWTLG